MMNPRIAQREFAAAAATADQTREQSVAMLGRAMMSTCRDIAGDHRADRFEPLPAYIALVRVGLQRNPLGARLAATGLRAHAVGGVAHRRARFTIGIGAAVDRVFDHPVESGVTRTPPDRIAIGPLCRKIKTMLLEPEQRLGAPSQFPVLLENKRATPFGEPRALAQNLELVLLEAPFENDAQPVVDVPGRVDRFLIDKNRVDDAAHLD